jgi:hypothetical protein
MMQMAIEIRFGHGPHRLWEASIVSGGVVLAYDYSSKPHAATWRNGARARADGLALDDNPYIYGGNLDSKGRISLGRRGFRNSWEAGWQAMDRAIRDTTPA